MILTLVTPLQPQFAGDPVISTVSLDNVLINPDTLMANCAFSVAGGGPARGRNLQVQLTAGLTLTQVLAAIKTQFESSYGIALQ
jgi:hypothetical protein